MPWPDSGKSKTISSAPNLAASGGKNVGKGDFRNATETCLTAVAKGHLRKQLFPNTRVYAVGAHKEIGGLFRSVLKCART
jgi:hypothetical protein